MIRIVIHPNVVKAIQSETERFPPVECAGLLLGVKMNNAEYIRIMRTYGDGPKSEQTYSSVSPDVQFFNKLIREAEREGLEFIGEWHKHPGTFSTPSQGDVAAIEHIMKVNNLVDYVAMIVTGYGENMEMNPFVFGMVPTYQKVDYEIERSDRTPEVPGTRSSPDRTEAKTRTRVAENRVPQEPEESVPPPGIFSRTIRKLRSKLFGKKNSLSSPEKEEKKTMKGEDTTAALLWYQSDTGKKRLLLEKRLMNQHFPDFSLYKKGSILFWSGAYRGYRIALTYPEAYPAKCVIIELTPSLPKVPDEKDCFYAVLAAQSAYLRIESVAEPKAGNSRESMDVKVI